MNIKDDINQDSELDVKIKMENTKPDEDFKNNKSSNNKNVSAKEAVENNPKEKVDFTNFLSHAHNPVVVFFTLVFKVAASVM